MSKLMERRLQKSTVDSSDFWKEGKSKGQEKRMTTEERPENQKEGREEP